jgi:uncharacterized protein
MERLQIAGWILGIGLVLYAAIIAAAYLSQRSLLFFPEKSRPDMPLLPGLQVVEIATADGVPLGSWYLPPPPGAPVIAYFHGNGGNIGYRSDRLRRFAAAGFGVLLLEYRGYGGNPGSPSEAGLFADARAGLAFLDGQGIAAGRLVLYGESLGTSVAVQMASERKVAALILESPFTSLADLARTHYPILPVFEALLLDRFDSLSRIGRVHAPILVLQGELDTTVPVKTGRRLFAAAPEPKELWTAPEGGHNDLAEFGAVDAAIGFVRQWVAIGY